MIGAGFTSREGCSFDHDLTGYRQASEGSMMEFSQAAPGLLTPASGNRYVGYWKVASHEAHQVRKRRARQKGG